MPEELDPPSPLSICEEVSEEPEQIHYIEIKNINDPDINNID